MTFKKISKFVVLAAASTLVLTSCSAETEAENEVEVEVSKEVTLIVHDSFPNEEFAAAASEATGYEVSVVTSGGGQELTTTLALTKGAPLADAFFGIDNIFASRLIENDVVEPFTPSNLPEQAKKFLFDEPGAMVPVTQGATCLNIDTQWFVDNDLQEPTSYQDLVDPAYKDLTVLIDPTASTTGGSFFLGTVAAMGEEAALDYWAELVDNGARLEQGWSDAYYSHFTAGSPDGTYPIVVSYSSSPAYTINDEGTDSSTKAVLDTCSSTVEYAGVLKGANNVPGAEAVIEYLLSSDFQNEIADSMYVYPIDESAYIPEEWQEFAPLPESPHDVSATDIGENRDDWLADLREKIDL